MAKVEQARTMVVPVDSLRRAILDFEKYPEFMPEVIKVKPGQRQEHLQLVEFEIEVIKRFQYTLEFDLKSPDEIRWRLVDSNFFTSNEGAWILEPASETKTKVRYELDVGVKFMVPKWIAKKLTEVNLPRLLDTMEQRAKSLAAGR